MQEEKTSSQTPPTKEELIAFFQEQIEVKKVQLELQEINAKLAVNRAEELKALSFIAQLTNPQAPENAYEGGQPHTITQEDIDNNPELAEQGIQVGDEVLIPTEPAKRSLKKKK
jgi:hypothetical protein